MSLGFAGSPRPSMLAPISRSGVASRRIGRRVSEASPSSVVSNGCPASSPVSRRMVVPELPQSSACAAACRPRKPTPTTRACAPAASTSMLTPSAASARAVDRLSPPRPSPVIATGPSESAPKSSARCEIDLSPGTVHRPRSGPERRARSSIAAHRWPGTMKTTSRSDYHERTARSERPPSLSCVAGARGSSRARTRAWSPGPRAALSGSVSRARRLRPCGTTVTSRRNADSPNTASARRARRSRTVTSRLCAMSAASPGVASRPNSSSCSGPPRSRRAPARSSPAGSSTSLGDALAHRLGHQRRRQHRGRVVAARQQLAPQLADAAAAHVGREAPGAVDGGAHRRRLAADQRARREQRDRLVAPLPDPAAAPARRRPVAERASEPRLVEAPARDGQRRRVAGGFVHARRPRGRRR